jgi:aspartyl-tRNA(Asn)/glutamyl-tRNA(Gln) amidotransferase subunit A
VPYAAKDLLATKGVPTTWGARPFAGRVIDSDATVIRKLREAGAVLLGKLAMIELAGGLGYVIPGASLTGAALNPWSLDRWTCGSSSGSGAAVAAGLVGFAIGTETWGSIVCPSSFCGISGIRPTFGRVSRHGAMALAWTFDKIGPMARTAEDCDAVLGAIGGHDPLDDWSAEGGAFSALPAATASRLKVAYVRLDFAKTGEKEVEEAFLKAIADLKGAGIAAEEVKLPELPFEETAGLMIGAEAGAAFEELFKDGRVRQLADRNAPLALAAGQIVTGSDYVKASRIRTICQRAMAEFFARWDVLLAPSEMMTAFPAGESFENVAWSDPVGGMGNLCGLPGASVPCGFGKGGLPVGLGIVGGAFEEAKVLAVAKRYQQVTDWHRKRPPLKA